MTYDTTVLGHTPVAYWKLEETTPPGAPPNLDCIDSSGNGHFGTLAPQPADFVQAISPGPITTDPSSLGHAGPIARIPSIGVPGGSLFLPDAQSWECWSKKTGTGVQTMINRGQSNIPDTYIAWGTRSTGLLVDNACFLLDWDALGEFAIFSCALANDTWYHIVGTRNGASMKLYVNGWLVASRADCPASSLTRNEAWRLGYMVNTVFGAVNWSAGLSHVAVYNYELSLTQIREHVIAGVGSLPSNPCGATPSISASCPATTATLGEPYSSSITVTGGTSPFVFSVFSGSLPTGLSLNTSTGAITGTPTATGTFNFVIRVTDAELLTADTPGCGIVVSAAPEPPEPPEPPPAGTFTFDALDSGLDSEWFMVLQLSDYGEELVDHDVKAFRVTGRVTDAEVRVYGYGALEDVNVDDLESGANSETGAIALVDTTEVQRSRRFPVNVKNVAASTIRINGVWSGTGPRNRIDEIVIEAAKQGRRR